MSTHGARVNPGNVSMRLGKTLEHFELAVFTSQLTAAANLVDLCATYVGVYMKPDQRTAYELLPGFSYGDKRTPGEVFQDLRKRLLWVLDIAVANKVFAYRDEEAGDASALDEKDEDATG